MVEALSPPPLVRKRVEQLNEFELGRWLLTNRGLNGFWTEYVIRFPDRGAASGLSSDERPLSSLEQWILGRAPIFLATQERFRIFQKELQKQVDSGARRLISLPCGLHDDLLSLNYPAGASVTVVGIDKDPHSLAQAAQKPSSANVTREYENKDAWNISGIEPADVLTSNGLNIYVEDDTLCEELYRSFASLLKPGGVLVTSFITPQSVWQPYSLEDLVTQRKIFLDTIGVAWQCVRSEELTRAQLTRAGFIDIECCYDRQQMFPTVVARRG